jgi:uncharacterized repeat protein (TIGR01451 family)
LLAADLALDISDAGATVEPGGTAIYSYEYANVGDSTANAVLQTTVPQHTSFNEAASSEGWECKPGRFRWLPTTCSLDLGPVEAGAGGVATFAVDVDEDVSPRVRSITNAAVISGDRRFFDGNDFGTESTPILRALHDLQLTLSSEEQEISPGGTLRYTIQYSNQGSVAAPGVRISFPIPAHTAFDESLSTGGWVCEDDVCSLDVGDVAAGAEGEAAVVVTVDADTPANVRHLFARASITDDGSGPADARPLNNFARESTRIAHALPDLVVRLDDGGGPVVPGGNIDYTVTFENVGPVDATGVVVKLIIPRGTSFSAAGSADGWSCDGRICSLEVGPLAAGESGMAALSVTVDAEFSSPWNRIYAFAHVSDDGENGKDGNRLNNFAFKGTVVSRAGVV